ncbi:MAG TPA: bifunctional diaminohydroxyphosphoribosylaminopyrimidine deaminase/5-amino-6-(5-phosphoribosylamino)uracil reductase RibD [Chthoniobacteraceae bacterium]|nr:bifunctional diaminohydroxyphosphoribosylaminopyrimidine deaminase/5-amino-6-(5-phosphoribosylamino)uracil reductase RibD [Chthoniobacteraceae bacterium]
MMNDELFMRAALREAIRGRGQTSPNPMVGAVLVSRGEIVARGFHRKAGEAHAEIEAIRVLRARSRRAGNLTLYVTLEPCSTRGRTPPCVDAILRERIDRVVIGTIDPNPVHAGRGVELLRLGGVRVTVGIYEAECRDLNKAFNHWIVTRMPFVTAKAGLSLDGRLTRPPGEGQWLTSDGSRREVQRLRASVDAVLVGANTIRLDNPRLTVRDPAHPQQPWRVVVTRGGRLPEDAHIFSDAYRDRTLVYKKRSLREVLRDLAKKEVTSVLIEGGMRILGEAFDRQLVNDVVFFVAPLVCGGAVLAVGGHGARATTVAPRIEKPNYRRIGSDLCVSGAVIYPKEI